MSDPKLNVPDPGARVCRMRLGLAPKSFHAVLFAGNRITAGGSAPAGMPCTVPLTLEIKSVKVTTTFDRLPVRSNGTSVASAPPTMIDWTMNPLGDPPTRRKYLPGGRGDVANR